MDDGHLRNLASCPTFYAFPLPKHFGFEIRQKTFYFPGDGGAEGEHDDSRKSPFCGFSWRSTSVSSNGGSSNSSSFPSRASFLTAAEFFTKLAAVADSTPFYLYDEARLRANCRRLVNAFRTLRAPATFPFGAFIYSASLGIPPTCAPGADSGPVTAAASSSQSVPASTENPHTDAREKVAPSTSSASSPPPIDPASSSLFLFGDFTNYFAVKATPTPAILKIIYEEGLGVDCSSLSELLLAEAVGFWGERIFFTSSCTSPEAYRKAYDLRAIINLDNPADIHRLPLYFDGDVPDILCFRYTPSGLDQASAAAWLTSSTSLRTATPAGPGAVTRASTGSGASQPGTAATPAAMWQVKKSETVRSNPTVLGEWHQSKFGMTSTQVLDVVAQAVRMGVRRIGLHSMTLSNSLDADEIVAAAACVFLLAKHIRDVLGVDVELINLGGGLGVPYKPGEAALDVNALAQKLQSCLLHIFCSNSNSTTNPNISSSSSYSVSSTLGSSCTSVNCTSINSTVVEVTTATADPDNCGPSNPPTKSTPTCWRSGIAEGNFAQSGAGTTETKPYLLPLLAMENGRIVTADAAVLVTRVTHLKHTYKNYIGVDACMANLMRPALYGAYHHITVVPDAEGRKAYTQFNSPSSFSPALPAEAAGHLSAQHRPRWTDALASTQAHEQPRNSSGDVALAASAQPERPPTRPEQKEGTSVLLVYDVVRTAGVSGNTDATLKRRPWRMHQWRQETLDEFNHFTDAQSAESNTTPVQNFRQQGRGIAEDACIPITSARSTYDTNVGGLCENNDKLAIDRLLPRVELGDLLLIHDVGAHGHAMGYNYNGCLRSMECLRRLDGTIELIRRAEDFEDLFSTVCYRGMPASAELWHLARYYSGVEPNDKQSVGSSRTSVFSALTARLKAQLFGGTYAEYEDEEACTCRAAAINYFCASLFLSTGIIGAAVAARLLFNRLVPPKG